MANSLDPSDPDLWGIWTDVKRTVLPNGTRVSTARLPRGGSISLTVGIEVGSRHEDGAESGVCHVLEHMVFRGSERWPTSFDLTSSIEGAGGALDGYTHREATVFHARLPRASMAHALDLIFDMVRRPRLRETDFATERDVVLEEVRQDAQAAGTVAEEAIDALLWPGHALNRSPGGTEETVGAMTVGTVARLWGWAYAPSRLIVTVAGDVDHAEVVALVSTHVDGWDSATEAPPFEAVPTAPTTPALESRWGEGQTAYVYAGVRGVASGDPDRPALELLSCAVGELASSRLWADLRDTRGLAYDVGSEVITYSDTGSLLMWAGVSPRRQSEAVARLVTHVRRASRGLEPEEFVRARNYVVGELTMSCETSEDMAHWLLWGELAHRRLVAPGLVQTAYERVTIDDVARAARRWSQDGLQVSIGGPAPKRGAKLINLLTSVDDTDSPLPKATRPARPRPLRVRRPQS
jgi:predicted Zn-dependent peptidase